MPDFIIYCFVFCFGFFVGSWFKNERWEGQAWKIYKWDSNVFGFRPVQIGSTLYKKDKVIMGIEVDPSFFPDEGHKYTD